MPPSTAAKKTGGAKKTSPYNDYMKVQLAKLKAEQEKSGKKVEHKENFKKVASLWKDARELTKQKNKK
ncbi:hypothetical protein Q5752_004770 [Cryptotrichosporon argae]